jgi:aryl-alcohol dehydrogenase-like predicted oxidoreductase
MDRRAFMRATAAAAGLVAARGAKGESLGRREYKDGVKLSVIGLGGIVVCGLAQNEADRTVAEAFDRGVNYYDVAPSYCDGEAETKLGPALVPFRSRSFLACKTLERDAAGARKELERSLARLRTDHFDLYQFHAVTSLADVDKIVGPGGAGEAFMKARREGKVRFLGASLHNVDAGIALMDRFPLDSVLFPVNFVLFQEGHFGPRILEHAKAKGVARLALKTLARQAWPDGADRSAWPKCWYQPIVDPALAEKSVRFTLSEDVTAAIPPGEAKLFRLALDCGGRFRPLSPKEREDLLESARGLTPIFRG